MYGLIKICLRNLSQFPHCAYLNDLAWPIINFSQLASRNLVKCQTFYVTLLQLTNKTSGCVCAIVHRGWCTILKIWSVFPSKIRTMVFRIRCVWIIKNWHLVLCIEYVWLIENLKSGPWYVLLSMQGLIFFNFLVQCMI